MRIIRLQAEGFKRLVAVDISPDGDLIEIRGENGNGKSSVLDAIFAALGGAHAAPVMPVREGEEAAVIRLDLGELIVTRYFTAAGTTGLKVLNREGFEAKGAQTMLDSLVGAISFDPLAFRDLKPEAQAEELRKLVTIADAETGEMLDLEELAAERKRVYDTRRDVNRDGVALKARIEAAGGVRHVPDDAPDRDKLRSQLTSAAETNEAVAAAERKVEEFEAALSRLTEHRKKLETELAEVIAKIATGETARAALPVPGERVDVAELSAKLEEADRVEDNRRANAARDALKAEFDQLAARSAGLTADLAAIDKRRAAGIAAAKMPVEGLALTLVDDELGVSFNGVPFSQASDAERLRVSAAVAMAANPSLRVLRLKDASLLDKSAVAALREMATSNDFQIWAEFVGDEGPGIIMEAGEVRGAPKPEPLPKPRQRKAKDAEGGDSGEKLTREGEVAEASVSHETSPGEGGAPSAPQAGENGGKASVSGGDVPGGKASPAAPSTLFERMADAAATGKEPELNPERRKPRAMSSFQSKPRS